MAKVARSSTTKKNTNKLVFHREQIFLQICPGNANGQSRQAVQSDIDFTLRVNGLFSQSGTFAKNGCAEVLIQGGCKAKFETLGSQYDVVPLIVLAAFDSFLGVQQRLRLLAYLNRPANDEWDDAIDEAILCFQADNGLIPNGLLCDNTMRCIKDAAGE